MITFADPPLEEAVRDAIDMLDGDIRFNDVAELSELRAGDRGIEEISGAECFAGLSVEATSANRRVSILSMTACRSRSAVGLTLS